MKNPAFYCRSYIQRMRRLFFLACCAVLNSYVSPETPTVASSSAAYTMEGSISIADVREIPLKSNTYEISSLVDKANNGIAIDSETKMIISWPEADENGLGYDVYSSPTGKAGSFAKMNAQPVTNPPYQAQFHANGTYYFMVYQVDLSGIPFQWTEIFSGTISGFNAARDWSLYE